MIVHGITVHVYNFAVRRLTWAPLWFRLRKGCRTLHSLRAAMHDSLDVTHKTFSAMAAPDELKVAFANFDKDNATQQLSDTGLHTHGRGRCARPARTARHPTRLGFSHPAGGITRGPWDRQGLSRVASAMFLALQEE